MARKGTCILCEEEFTVTKNFKNICRNCISELPDDNQNVKLDFKIKNTYKTIPKDKGIGGRLNTLNFGIGKTYKISQRKNGRNPYGSSDFEGSLIQDDKDHITLKHRLGYCESFRKYDLILGDYKITEVKK